MDFNPNDRITLSGGRNKSVGQNWNHAAEPITKNHKWIRRAAGASAVLLAGATNFFEPITTDPSLFTKYNIPPAAEMFCVWATASLVANWITNLVTNPEHAKMRINAENKKLEEIERKNKLKEAGIAWDDDPALMRLEKKYTHGRGVRLIKGVVVAAVAVASVKYFGPILGVPPDSHASRYLSALDRDVSRLVGGFTHSRNRGGSSDYFSDPQPYNITPDRPDAAYAPTLQKNPNHS